MLVKSAEFECRGLLMKTATVRSVYKHSLTISLVMDIKWILRRHENLIAWRGMSLKLAKSRSFVMKNGKLADNFRFSKSGTTLPTLTEKPVNSLGKDFNCS